MADNFFADYPVEGGSGGGVTTLNGLSGALTLVAGSGITITPSGSTITISSTGGGGTVTAVTASSPLASSGGTTPNISLTGIVAVANGGTSLATLTANNVILGNGTSAPLFVAPGTSGNVLTSNGTTWISSAAAPSGANTFLSNLTSPTAVNQDLIFNTGAAANLKTQDAAGNTQNLSVITGNASGANDSGELLLETGTGESTGSIQLLTGNPTTADFNSGAILVSTGTPTGAGLSGGLALSTGASVNGNSGDISLSPGTPSGTGTRGQIVFQDGTEGTAGQVWTSSDTTGRGHWAAAGGGSSVGANVNRGTSQGIGATTQLLFNASQYTFDTNGFSATDNQFTVNEAGIYTITSYSVFNTSNTYAFIEYSINGGPNVEFAFGYAPSAVNPRVVGAAILNLAANDVITFFGTSGLGGGIFTNLSIGGP